MTPPVSRPQRQEAACRQLCEIRGWTIDRAFEDVDVSAYSEADRPAVGLRKTVVFDAIHEPFQERDGFRLTVVWIGSTSELNVFELAGNTEHERQVPTFGRGRLDHLALEAASHWRICRVA